MTLFSLAKKNIKGNLQNYLVYFISLVFSMVIYYTFVSLQYSEKIQNSIEVSDSMSFMFGVSSVVLILFVAIFILYSNSSFTKRRKKEVGLYSLLGLRKKTIGKMLFYENLILGIIALTIGILIGTLLSKLFSMILVNLMGLTIKVNLELSFEAIIQTIVVFMIIILFTSIQGYRLIYRFKLIELFHAEKKGETVPKVSWASTVIGVILLAVSYGLILRPFPDELGYGYLVKNDGAAFVALVIGTYLFFRSVTVFLLKLSRRNKSRYYRGTRLIETSQLLHRIRGNARSLTIIALLSAATITFFAAPYSLYSSIEKSSEEAVPFSYSFLSKGLALDAQVTHTIETDQKHPIKSQLDISVIETQGKLSFPLDYEINPVQFISARTFNQAAKALNRKETVTLSGNQAAVIRPRFTEYPQSVFKGQHITLQLPKDIRKLTFVSMVNGNVLPFDYPDFFIIVGDDLFAKLADQKTPLTYKVYEVENEKTAKTTSEKINQLVGKDFQAPPSFYTAYKKAKEAGALRLFMTGFLGLVFLVATGSIIYFKQLTEANEAKAHYDILRKLGISKKATRQSIKKQTRFVFGLPLAVSILHSSVILYFLGNFISDLIGTNMMIPILTAMAAFVIIYASYYVLTVNTYNNIVNRR